MDEILGYLLDDLDALKASSLTCKRLFGATRPLIHRRLVCLGLNPDLPKPKRSLFSRRKRDLGLFERLIDADRSGVLRYTRHLTIKVEDGYRSQRGMQEHLPHLRSITKLDTLTLNTFPLHPVFHEQFGIFTNTLRHLDIRNAYGTAQHLSYIICRFPLLEDLTIMSPAETPLEQGFPEQGFYVPTITQSPPLRGTLVLAQTRSQGLYEGLAALPGGLNFRSLELFDCGDPQAVFASCGRTVTSISHAWLRGDVDSERVPLFRHILRCNLWDYSDRNGSQSMRGSRKIRVRP